MKLPEPVAWMDRDGDVYKELPTPYWHPPHQALFSDAQLNEILNQEEVEHEANERNLCQLTDELAESRREVAQLQEQNTYLDKVASELQDTCDMQAKRLASHEAVMRQALEALEKAVGTCFSSRDHMEFMGRPDHFCKQAIKALEEQLK